MMKPIQVGLIGLGTVGTGVFEVLRRNHEEIERRAGRAIQVTMVSRRDTARAKAVVGEAAQVVADPRDIIRSPDIDVVVELIGGYDLARELVLEAIEAAFARSAPDFRGLQLIEGAGHWVQFEAPEALDAALATVLKN